MSDKKMTYHGQPFGHPPSPVEVCVNCGHRESRQIPKQCVDDDCYCTCVFPPAPANMSWTEYDRSLEPAAPAPAAQPASEPPERIRLLRRGSQLSSRWLYTDAATDPFDEEIIYVRARSAGEQARLKICLKEMMRIYESRIRSLCTPEQLEQQPWRVSEYVAAEDAIKEN